MAGVQKITSLGGPGPEEQYGVLIARAMVERTRTQRLNMGYVNAQTMRQIMDQKGLVARKFALGWMWLKSGHHLIANPVDKDSFTLSSTGMRLGGA